MEDDGAVGSGLDGLELQVVGRLVELGGAGSPVLNVVTTASEATRRSPGSAATTVRSRGSSGATSSGDAPSTISS